MDALTREALRRGLRTRVIGRDVRVCGVVPSTIDVAWEEADRGAAEGLVVFAEEQTRGRGRLGRTWWSPRGAGLWMSVLLRPPREEGEVPTTTLVGALAAAEAIRETAGLPAMIRWPNDVLVDDRKVAGVLVEARQTDGGGDLVLGIGIDVNVAAAEIPPELAGIATSLSEAAGKEIDRVALARSLLRQLDRWYRAQLERDTAFITGRWRALSATLGREIVLEEGGRRFEGTVIDLDARDGLALRLTGGSIRHFRGEHVTVVRHG